MFIIMAAQVKQFKLLKIIYQDKVSFYGYFKHKLYYFNFVHP